MRRTRMVIAISLGLVAVAAASHGCGGASAEIGPGRDGGADGDFSRGPAPDCHRVTCVDVACGAGYEKKWLPGECCTSCVPVASACTDTARSCSSLVDCARGSARVEYAAGCCACRPNECSEVQCKNGAACAAGEHLELAGCCTTCVKDGACGFGGAPCTSFECPTGFKATSKAADGAGCCSSCQPDCNLQRQAFETWLEGRIGKLGALSCSRDEDCVVDSLTNDCAVSCGRAIASAFQGTLRSEVASYASAHCNGCQPEDIVCPPVILTARCDGKRCKLTPGF